MDSTLAAETQNFLVPNATIIVVFLIFLAVLGFFYRFVVPPLTKAMAERDEMNKRQAEERDAAVRRLAEAQERYDAALADARAQATAVKDEARADAQRIRDEMRAETDRKVAAIRERGEAELAEQRAEALQALRGQIGGLSTDLAGRILGRPVAHDDQNVAGYLAELDERQTAGGKR
jgi:F-type H+-transporting ATPase subunit b